MLKTNQRGLEASFAVFLQLADDNARILNRIGAVDRIDIDEVQQYAAALEVLEEADTEACPFRCAFNQPRISATTKLFSLSIRTTPGLAPGW